MSAKKSGAQHPAGRGPDPAAVVLLAREVRRLLRFHLAIGLDRYPASEPVKSFLGQHRRGLPGPAHRPGPPARRRRDVKAAAATGGPPLPAGRGLAELRSAVQACTLCGLAGKSRDRIHGVGADTPRLLVVGDWGVRGDGSGELVFGPGEDGMLARMMAAIGLSRDEYHVTNVLKCFPAGPQPPPDAAAACRAWLVREIAILRPRLVCAMGELAARVLTGSRQPLARTHGRLYGCRCAGDRPVQVLPTYHPRLLLRQQELKQVAWQDLQKVARFLARADSRQGRRAEKAAPKR